jgi:hypothetical protein
MKNKKLLFGFLSLILAGSIMIFATSATKKNSKYIPRTEQNAKNKTGINGAVEYLAAMRNNPITGDISPKWVADAEKDVKLLANQKSKSSLGLSWTELGPDNIGGRTRAILIDKDNSNIMYAGGVSGGLWKSTTAGSSWVKLNDLAENTAIVSIAQDKNGAIYAGTGEGMANGTGNANGSTGFIGKGIYKSTDGTTFSLLPSTQPSADNTISTAWVYINKLACDPNTGRVYAATNKGLRSSDDGGATWIIPVKLSTGTDNNASSTDVDVSNDGTVVTVVGNKCYVSTNGDNNTFVNQSNGQSGDLPSGSISRIEFAISPTNSSYIYASVAKTDGSLLNIYRSSDRGDKWTVIGPGGSQTFQPLGTQGWYDNTIMVHPTDTNKIYVGGLDLWTWQKGGTWEQKTLWYLDPSSAYYIHADHHVYVFNPTNPDIMYAGSDGGISRSSDGGNTWQTMNKNYNTIQCYALACSGDGKIMTGCQDNGTLYLPRTGTFHMKGYSVMGGDGGWPAFSNINPEVYFATVYYAGTGRSPDMGVTFTPSADGSNPFFSTRMTAGATPGDAAFPASFVTPLLIWESLKDLYSHDSIQYVPEPIVNEKMGTGGNNDSTFSNTLSRNGQNAASIVPLSIKIIVGNLVVTDDGSGGFTGDVNPAGTNTIDYTTGAFNIHFASAPAVGSAILCTYDIEFAAGDDIIIDSKTRPGKFIYTTPTSLTKTDTIMIQDIVQSKFFMGFNNGIWMTKRALDFSKTPQWFKVATITPSTYESTQCMSISNDGNYLFVGTSNGKLIRVSNLRSAQDSLSADVTSSTCQVVTKQLTIPSGGSAITSIAIDPSDANKIIVTLGNYGGTTYIYRSINATDTIPTFTAKQGNLPKMPVYASLIPLNNPNVVILGTEYGVYATDNISATTVQWTDENSGMANVPVYMIKQQTVQFPDVTNYGTIYIGTHGRGVFECTKYTSLNDNNSTSGLNNPSKPLSVSLYPNPVIENATIKFNLAKSEDVKIKVYNIQGKLIRTFDMSTMAAGSHTYSFDCKNISKGTYIVNVISGTESATAKFVKMQ